MYGMTFTVHNIRFYSLTILECPAGRCNIFPDWTLNTHFIFFASSKHGFSQSVIRTSSSDTGNFSTSGLGLSVPTLGWFCHLRSTIWHMTGYIYGPHFSNTAKIAILLHVPFQVLAFNHFSKSSFAKHLTQLIYTQTNTTTYIFTRPGSGAQQSKI